MCAARNQRARDSRRTERSEHHCLGAADAAGAVNDWIMCMTIGSYLASCLSGMTPLKRNRFDADRNRVLNDGFRHCAPAGVSNQHAAAGLAVEHLRLEVASPSAVAP